MKIYFILLALSTQAFALECHDSETPLIMFKQEIFNILPEKKCPSSDEVIQKQVEDEYKKFYGREPQVRQAVKGYHLEASAKEIKLANTMLGDKPPKGWNAAAKDCKTLQCAFEKLLNSKEAAKQLFNIHAKSNYLLSLDQTINQSKADQIWSPKEIREMDAGISKLPAELTDLPHLNVIERMADGYKRSTSSSNTAAFASPRIQGYKKAELVFYDSGMSGLSTKNPYLTKSWPQEVLIHEICHHYDFKGYYATNHGKMTTEQTNSEFSKLSGWKKTTGSNGQDVWKSTPNSKFVSDYAETQPAEDFAETCANYILNPDKLRNLAPTKYTFMKSKIFNNKEFGNKPWTNSSKTWAPLTALLGNEKDCSAKLSECVQNISFDNGNFCQSTSKTEADSTWTSFSCGSASKVLKGNACLNNYKNDRIKEMDGILQAEADYCSMNGPDLLRSSSDRICEKTINNLATQLEKTSKYDLSAEVSACESAKDYTEECITAGVYKNLKIDPELRPTIGSIMKNKIPGRMESLSKKLSAMNTSTWLKPCLSVVSGIIKYQDNYQYDSTSKEYSSGFLANYIHKDYTRKDINMACSREMLKGLEAQGYKTSSSDNAVNLINDSIKAEIRSFEKGILGKIGEATRGCLLPSCKTNRISTLLQSWEEEDPSKRRGFATKEYAKELQKKFSEF